MLTIYIDADKEVKLKQIENKIMMIDWHILTDNSCFIKGTLYYVNTVDKIPFEIHFQTVSDLTHQT